MDIEISFINLNKLSIDFIKEQVIDLCKENNWYLEMQNKPNFDTYKNGNYEFSIFQDDKLLLHAQIFCESFRNIWFLKETDSYPKKHLGENCYYILNYLYLGGDGYDISFMLEFAIKLLEKIPNTIVETLEKNVITQFEEYNLNQLKELQQENITDNWKNHKDSHPIFEK